jgi:DNA repair protein RecN (Recombination protein N)
MLRELRIQNVAIIEDVVVRFGPGLNVLSGETGAGKSIILGALGLVLGARASADIVRTGGAAAEVLARFDLDEPVRATLEAHDVAVDDDEDGLLVRRVVTAAGRSRAYIGAQSVPTSTLRSLAGVLVDYASQHEHRVLLDEARHRTIVDRFGGHDALLAEVDAAVKALRDCDDERTRLLAREADQRARLDFLEFQLGELDAFGPSAGEEEALEQERTILNSAAQLSEHARAAERALYSGSSSGVERLGEARKRLAELAATDGSLAPLLETITEALYAVEDAARELGKYGARTRHDPDRLQEIEDRLAELKQLTRKHRTNADGLVALRSRLQAEVDELGTLDVRLDELERALARRRVAAKDLCVRLTEARRLAGVALGARVETELHSLAMPKARLLVELAPLPSGEGVALADDGPWAHAHGADAVSLLFSANLGEEPRPLARVASGGELSRILLSVRRALAGTRSVAVQVCVFDEIDSGLGGATAESVAEKLVSIAEEGQVLAITHLPHIAAAGAAHFRVAKRTEGGRTHTDVERLDGEARVDELVRMVAGTGVTAAAESFARELLRGPNESPPPARV